MMIPVKKTFHNAGHMKAKLINVREICPKKIQRNRPFFTDCFLAKFPPEISGEIGQIFEEFAPENPLKFGFFRWNPAKLANFSANFDFFPAKIQRNRPIFREFAPKILWNFAFFREIFEALFKQGQNRRVLAAQTQPDFL